MHRASLKKKGEESVHSVGGALVLDQNINPSGLLGRIKKTGVA